MNTLEKKSSRSFSRRLSAKMRKSTMRRCLKVYRFDGEEKEGVKKVVLKKEEEVVQLSMKPSPVPVVKKEKKAEKRKETEVEEIEEEITDETKASVAQKARKHKWLHSDNFETSRRFCEDSDGALFGEKSDCAW